MDKASECQATPALYMQREREEERERESTPKRVKASERAKEREGKVCSKPAV